MGNREETDVDRYGLKFPNFMKVILRNLPLHIYLAKTNMIKTLLHITLKKRI
ncbi:hypothetical protein ACUNO0_000172 [Campylobacter jejuni]